jgi:hypothetical protein
VPSRMVFMGTLSSIAHRAGRYRSGEKRTFRSLNSH